MADVQTSYLATVPGGASAGPVVGPGGLVAPIPCGPPPCQPMCAPKVRTCGGWAYNPLAWIIAVIITFVIILAILFMLSPSIVTTTDSNGNTVIDRGKLFCWAVGITIVVLIILWVFAAAY